MRNITAITLGAVVLALVGCNDAKPQPKPRTYLALLGNKSDAVIEHVQSTCPGHVVDLNSDGITNVMCFLPDYVYYAVVFDHRARIRSLEIYGTLIDATAIYERAFAPIVPDELREILRESLRTPKHDWIFWRPGGAVTMYAKVDDLLEGQQAYISWSVLDVDGTYSIEP
jgi:hypothetical protein